MNSIQIEELYGRAWRAMAEREGHSGRPAFRKKSKFFFETNMDMAERTEDAKREAVRLRAEGASNEEIAKHLHVTARTVSRYLHDAKKEGLYR